MLALLTALWNLEEDAGDVQFADICEVLEMTVAEIQEQAAVCCFPMLGVFTRLVHLACRLMSTEAERSSVERVVRAAVQTRGAFFKSYQNLTGRVW